MFLTYAMKNYPLAQLSRLPMTSASVLQRFQSISSAPCRQCMWGPIVFYFVLLWRLKADQSSPRLFVIYDIEMTCITALLAF